MSLYLDTLKEKNVKDFPMYVIGNMTPQELHE